MKIKAYLTERRTEGGPFRSEPVVLLTFAVIGHENGTDDAFSLEMTSEPYTLQIENEAEGRYQKIIDHHYDDKGDLNGVTLTRGAGSS